MRNRWTDADIDRVLSSLKDEPVGAAFWKDRVWRGIEAGLPEEAKRRLPKPWYRDTMALRGVLVAACFLLAVGLWRVQVVSVDNQLEDFVSNLTVTENGGALELAGLGAEVRCENLKGPVDAEDSGLLMESLYETL